MLIVLFCSFESFLVLYLTTENRGGIFKPIHTAIETEVEVRFSSILMQRFIDRCS